MTVGDIATIAYRYKEPVARIRLLGEPALAVNTVRETGANVIETMEGIREAVAELNAASIPQAGLVFEQVYDETVYIDSAIDLVQQNIFVGGALAALILLLFLRSFSATLIVSVAIPVSVVGSFVAMALLGRSINVISLAGLAFAVGMVVDAAIVVLENIYRLRQSGYGRLQAAYYGARQVWGAVFVSAATTVLVFVPILVMELEAGQLFRDIAVAISVSVVLSLVVASTVIPSLASRILGRRLLGVEQTPVARAVDDAAPRRASPARHRRCRRAVRPRRAGLHRVGRAPASARGRDRARRLRRRAGGLVVAAAASRLSAHRQPQPGVRRRASAAGLQPGDHDRHRALGGGRGAPALGIGDRAGRGAGASRPRCSASSS